MRILFAVIGMLMLLGGAVGSISAENALGEIIGMLWMVLGVLLIVAVYIVATIKQSSSESLN